MEIKVLASSSKGNSYWVNDGKTQLLLDAGIPFKVIQQKLNFMVSDIVGVLITHRHGDHSLAVKDMLKRGMKVYGNIDTEEHFKGMRILSKGNTVGIGTFDVTPYEMIHDALCFAYEIYSYNTGERLVYVTDTADIPCSFMIMDYLLVEANHDENILKQNVTAGTVDPVLAKRISATHMEINRLVEWLMKQNRSRLKEIYLLHLSDKNSDESTFKMMVQMLTCAEVHCENWQ